MKRSHAIVLCLFLALCAVSGVSMFRNAAAVNAEATAPTTHPLNEEMTLAQGTAAIISAAKTNELTQWKSSDESVVSVDDGGRVDALKRGNATVTAVYQNGREFTCDVTVSAPAEEEAADIYSTAIIANQDVLQKNLRTASGGASQKHPYRLHVNRSQNCVTAYTYDEDGKYTVPVRAMVCSCGLNNTTITGTYSIGFHSEWYPLAGDVVGQYASSIFDDYMFHSVPYITYAKDSLETEEYNKLGAPASKGCIRMAVSDVKWVNDNCEEGTVVFLFDNDRSPGPLGKPESIKITDLSNQWDPTDNDTGNPYNTQRPQITGAKNLTLTVGDDYDPAQGVSATDTCGNDITQKLAVIGNVNTAQAGTYRVSYSVADVLHRTASADITVTVKEASATSAK